MLTYLITELHTDKPEGDILRGKKFFTARIPDNTLSKIKKEKLRIQYGENKKIADNNYDSSLAIKCFKGV